MTVATILESLLIASESPLPASEAARLIRARGSELSDNSITENAECQPPLHSSEAVLNLKNLSETGEQEILETITELNKHYAKTGRSFVIVERAKGWKIHTRPDYAGFIKFLFPGRKPERLSPPAMETLAIIAYRQPVTKSALEAVRGVSCDGMLQKLLDRELVKITGRADLPGRPLLYGTTDLFLEHFGITNLEELPNTGELRAIQFDKNGENEAQTEGSAGLEKTTETQLVLSAVEKKTSSGDPHE